MTSVVLLRMDILGFTRLMDSSNADRIMDKIERVVKRHSDRIRWMPKDMKSELKIHPMYGDTLDIYYECGENDSMLIGLLDMASDIMSDFVNDGILVRGAVIRGNLRDNGYVFTGKAMAAAHDEEKGCCFPSVSMDKNIVSTLREQLGLLFGMNSVEKEGNYIFEHGDKCYLDYIKRDKKMSERLRDVIECYRKRAVSPEEEEKCSVFEASLNDYESLLG